MGNSENQSNDCVKWFDSRRLADLTDAEREKVTKNLPLYAYRVAYYTQPGDNQSPWGYYGPFIYDYDAFRAYCQVAKYYFYAKAAEAPDSLKPKLTEVAEEAFKLVDMHLKFVEGQRSGYFDENKGCYVVDLPCSFDMLKAKWETVVREFDLCMSSQAPAPSKGYMYMSVADLAKNFNVENVEALRKRLDRYRQKNKLNAELFIESQDRGRTDELTPPRQKIFVGDGDFKKIGQEFLQYFIQLGELKPDEKVLDIGCGIGRMAVPLTKYLDERSKYEGFDIIADGISWCREKISPKYPNFHFQLADVFNKRYNPNGKHKASEYRFPYENETFDFVFLTSVFTHMLPEDMENYFRQIKRILKKDKRCLITFFLLNKESLQLINAGKSTLDFKYELGEFRTININRAEDAVCYDEAFVFGLYEKYGLKIKQPIRYGSWCGRSNFLSYQDIIIASKE